MSAIDDYTFLDSILDAAARRERDEYCEDPKWDGPESCDLSAFWYVDGFGDTLYLFGDDDDGREPTEWIKCAPADLQPLEPEGDCVICTSCQSPTVGALPFRDEPICPDCLEERFNE